MQSKSAWNVDGFYDSERGKALFLEQFDMSKDLLCSILYCHGASSDPFGEQEWEKHPLKVLKSLRLELDCRIDEAPYDYT